MEAQEARCVPPARITDGVDESGSIPSLVTLLSPAVMLHSSGGPIVMKNRRAK
jgi:hypothetical protein